MEQIKLEYPFGEFYVEIIRKKIKNVHLKVYRELKVAISVPIYAEKSWIESFVQDKKEWVGKQLEKYIKSSGYNNLLDLKSGSSTQFLGRDLRVYLVQSQKEKIEQDEKSVHRRLDNLEKLTESVHVIATEIKAMREDVNNLTVRVYDIENRPKKRFDAIIISSAAALIGAVFGYLLK